MSRPRGIGGNTKHWTSVVLRVRCAKAWSTNLWRAPFCFNKYAREYCPSKRQLMEQLLNYAPTWQLPESFVNAVCVYIIGYQDVFGYLSDMSRVSIKTLILKYWEFFLTLLPKYLHNQSFLQYKKDFQSYSIKEMESLVDLLWVSVVATKLNPLAEVSCLIEMSYVKEKLVFLRERDAVCYAEIYDMVQEKLYRHVFGLYLEKAWRDILVIAEKRKTISVSGITHYDQEEIQHRFFDHAYAPLRKRWRRLRSLKPGDLVVLAGKKPTAVLIEMRYASPDIYILQKSKIVLFSKSHINTSQRTQRWYVQALER